LGQGSTVSARRVLSSYGWLIKQKQYSSKPPFEDFSVASNAHTDVILVTNKDVTKDGDIDKTAIVDLGPLTGTSGMQDFAVPASADAMTFHTVVLWDTAMTHAIAAAPLK
jgi:hypothetical protein